MVNELVPGSKLFASRPGAVSCLKPSGVFSTFFSALGRETVLPEGKALLSGRATIHVYRLTSGGLGGGKGGSWGENGGRNNE
jgi:hypothetical protein